MADPVFITSLSLQIGELLKQLYEYGRHVTRAQEEIRSLCFELLSLRGILQDIKNQRTGKSADNGLSDLVKRARLVVDDMLRNLTPHLLSYRSIPQSLTWPLETSSVDVTLLRLKRMKENLLTIMMGGVSGMIDDVNEAEIESTKTTTCNALSRSKEQESAARVKLVELLAPVSPESAHRQACAVWGASQSGEWFLQGPFRSWLEEPNPASQIMALCGTFGAGKSAIISRVVATQRVMGDLMPLAYFYCTAHDSKTQKARNIFGSWLVQLATLEPSVLEPIAELQSLPDSLQLDLIQDVVIGFAERNGPVLLVLDGMNESRESSEIAYRIGQLVLESRKVQFLISTTQAMVGVFGEHGISILQVDIMTNIAE